MIPECKRCKQYHAWQSACDDGGYYGTKYTLLYAVRRDMRRFFWRRLRIDFTSKTPLHWWTVKQFKSRYELKRRIKAQ